jgi:hypothetical protein
MARAAFEALTSRAGLLRFSRARADATGPPPSARHPFDGLDTAMDGLNPGRDPAHHHFVIPSA